MASSKAVVLHSAHQDASENFENVTVYCKTETFSGIFNSDLHDTQTFIIFAAHESSIVINLDDLRMICDLVGFEIKEV